MQRVWQPINKTAGESKWLKLHILNIVLTGDTDYIVAYQILKFDLFGKHWCTKEDFNDYHFAKDKLFGEIRQVGESSWMSSAVIRQVVEF